MTRPPTHRPTASLRSVTDPAILPEIAVEPDGPTSGVLRLPEQPYELATLIQAIGSAAGTALSDAGLQRLEVDVRADDLVARRALLRSGFRLEGTRRRAIVGDGGEPVDQLIFARLDDDRVDGPDGFSAAMNSALPRKRLIAHVLMRDGAGRILLCDTMFKTDWELPGGIVEPYESPRQGAIREVREELGIDIQLGRLLAADWMPPYLGWDDAEELIFDGGTVTEAEIDAYVLQASEIRSVQLATLAEAEPHLTALSFRRLSAILELDTERTLTMEDGRPV